MKILMKTVKFVIVYIVFLMMIVIMLGIAKENLWINIDADFEGAEGVLGGLVAAILVCVIYRIKGHRFEFNWKIELKDISFLLITFFLGAWSSIFIKGVFRFELLDEIGRMFSRIHIEEDSETMGQILTHLINHKDFVLVYMMGMIIAPIIEEVIFRGLFLKLLIDDVKKGVGYLYPLIISSLLFGFVHGPEEYAIVITGMFLGLLYLQNRNIIFPIFFHMGANMGMVIWYGAMRVRPIYGFVFIDKQGVYSFSIGFILISILVLGIFFISLIKTVFAQEPEALVIEQLESGDI